MSEIVKNGHRPMVTSSIMKEDILETQCVLGALSIIPCFHSDSALAQSNMMIR